MDSRPWSWLRSRLYSLVFRAPKSNRLLVSVAALSPEDHALDIGCGPGAAVRMAAGTVVDGRAVGVDRAQPMVAIARRRSRRHRNVSFEVGTAESLPFPDGSFTVAWTAHSFHHWQDRLAGLAEMRRVLVDGGRAFILEKDGAQHGLTDREARAVVADMERLGFDDVVTSKEDDQLVISAVAGPQ